MSNNKILRVNEAMFRSVTGAIGSMSADGIENVTVLSVETSADLSSAKVFVDIEGDEGEKQAIMAQLEKSAGYLRSEVAKTVTLRQMPTLRFIMHKGRENAARVEELLAQIQRDAEPNN